MKNPRWALLSAGLQLFVLWWLIDTVAEGAAVNIIPAVIVSASLFVTFQGWVKLDRAAHQKATR
jgi:hypothetical protein